MSLRPLLTHLADDPSGVALAREGGRAFVSSSLRPYLVAAVLDGIDDAAGLGRPAIVVAGDDRQARDLAADLRAWLHPRPVRFYPSRGVAYESHLAPPPHLVGLRVAALDALLGSDQAAARGDEPPVVVVSAVALSREGPRPGAAPARPSRCARATCSTSTRSPPTSSPPATSASTRSRTAASSRSAAACSTSTRRRRTARSASTCSTSRSRRCAGSRPSRSAPGGDRRARGRPGGRAGRRAPRAGRDRRAERRRGPPRRRRAAARSTASTPSWTSRPQDAAVVLAAEEEIAPALADHWQDVCAAFHDEDAHHLYVKPEDVRAALDARARIRLSSISGDQPLEFRAQAADLAARSLKEAEPELEKLVRSRLPDRRHLAAPRRGRARGLQPRAPAGALAGRGGGAARRRGRGAGAALRHGDAARRLHRRRAPRSRSSPSTASSAAAAPSAPRARTPAAAAAARCARSPTCARATSSSTRTTASPASRASTRRPSAASPATTSSSSTPAPTRSSCRSTSSRRSPATSARAAATRR